MSKMILPQAPLSFTPIYKEKIWGGQSLKTKLNKPIPDKKNIGECWELSGYGDDQSIVDSGPLVNKTLTDIYEQLGKELIGKIPKYPNFPLLYKFIDAQDKLSVQVHPDDLQAKQNNWGNFGKTECWYVVDAKEDAQIIVGFKEKVSIGDVAHAVATGSLEQILNYIPITTGDLLFIPAGTVHAIMDETLIYEVQETSDTTFRLYDWGRTDDSGKPRDLHIDEALRVLDTTVHSRHRIEPVVIDQDGYKHAFRTACSYFAIEQFAFMRDIEIELPTKQSFRVVTNLGENAKLQYGEYFCNLEKGCSILIPAKLDKVIISGVAGTRFLLSSVPDLKNEVIDPLVKVGIPKEAIALLGGNPDKNDLLKMLF